MKKTRRKRRSPRFHSAAQTDAMRRNSMKWRVAGIRANVVELVDKKGYHLSPGECNSLCHIIDRIDGMLEDWEEQNKEVKSHV